MLTTLDEIADGIYRISTFVPEIGPDGFTFNQFLLDAEEPLLYHTGMKGLFPLVSREVARVRPLDVVLVQGAGLHPGNPAFPDAGRPARRQQVITDGHAPAEYRADTVRNLDAWYAAFAVKQGDKMYLAPDQRVRIW